MLTPLGLVVVPWTLACLMLNKRHWVPWLMSASVPFMTASALTVGSNKISPFFLAAVAPTGLALLDFGRPKPRSRVVSLGLLLAAYFVATAMVLPVIFEGWPVLVPRSGIDEQVVSPGELSLSISNLAQSLYVVLAIGTVVYFVRNPPRHLHFLALGLGIGTALNFWALLSQHGGPAFPADFFSAGAIEEVGTSSFEGTTRLRGVYAEPSYLATFALAGAAYFAALATTTRGWRLLLTVAAFLANLGCLYFSFSGSAVAASIGFVALVALFYGWRTLSGTSWLAPATIVASLIAVIIVLALWDTVIADFLDVLDQKLSSTSYDHRSGADAFSLHTFFDTYGFGVGLGSSRPSSFALMLLSNVGVIGALLFVLLAVRAVGPALVHRELAPEALAFIATIVAKCVAEPNLAQPVMWLSLAACAGGIARLQRTDTAIAEPARS